MTLTFKDVAGHRGMRAIAVHGEILCDTVSAAANPTGYIQMIRQFAAGLGVLANSCWLYRVRS